MMAVVFLSCQSAQGASSHAMKSQSTTTSSESPDEAGGDEAQSDSAEKIYGTWIANDVDAKMGEVKIKLTFRKEWPMTILAWSDIPFAGKVKDLKEPYEVHGDTISSEAIRDGKKAKFSFENDQLWLRFKSGKVVRFDRE